MTKYNVGDKVRILNAGAIIGGIEHWSDGDVTEVTEVKESPGRVYLRRVKTGSTLRSPYLHRDELQHIELATDKPTKNQRITELESKVAELEAKFEALKEALQGR